MYLGRDREKHNKNKIMKELTCTGVDGISNTFYFDKKDHDCDGSISITVWVKPQREGNSLELLLVPFDSSSYRIQMITHNRKSEFKAKGIPDTLLPVVSQQLKKRIISSRKRKITGCDEYRTDEADKMWDRLVEKGIAEYDNTTGRYSIASF
jgi:hypothetical protein